MDIYIDESGGFIPKVGGGTSASAVIGLVVPSERRALLAKEFKKLRKRLRPGARELKGSSISEREAAEFCTLLRAHGVLVEAIAIDMGAHSSDTVTKFKQYQSERILDSLTREFHPTMVEEVWVLSESVLRMSNQLFVQAFCSVQLIKRVFENARTYYAFRAPKELGSYSWQVDAKSSQLTAMEEAWKMLALVALTISPTGMIPGGDYSYDDDFAPVEPSPPAFAGERGQIDIGSAIRDRMRFVDSEMSLGVQMADIMAGIVTRALNGRLERSGWSECGRLFVREHDSAIRVIVLDPDASAEHRIMVADHPWHPTLMAFTERAQPMVPKEAVGRVRDAFRSLQASGRSP